MMRNFDERKQEILRRAEARIQHRKKVKKQLLGVGIPTLCVAVCLGVFLSRDRGSQAEPGWEERSAAADAPVAAAPTVDPAHEPADYYDCTSVDAPAEPQPWEIPNLLKGIPGETFTEYEGVYIRTDEENLALLGTPVFLCGNQSGEFVHLEDRDLFRWEDGQWVSCAVDIKVRGEPMEIPPSSGDMAAAFGVSYREYDYTRSGLYRYVCTFRVGEDETSHTMWAEFTLEEPALVVDALGSFGSEYPGIYLEFYDVFLEEGRIQAFWRNETALPARIYEGYDLQYLDGDTWVSCKKEYPQFGENIYELAPWPAHVDMDYSISPEQFNLSRAGEYRLTAQFWVEGDDTLHTAWAWFTLSMQKQ